MDWVAAFICFVALVLCARKHWFCWPLWLVQNVLWIIWGFAHEAWALTLLQIPFAVMNGIGWLSWAKADDKATGRDA